MHLSAARVGSRGERWRIYGVARRCVCPKSDKASPNSNPETQATNTLEKPVFMDSGFRPGGGPGMTILYVIIEAETLSKCGRSIARPRRSACRAGWRRLSE